MVWYTIPVDFTQGYQKCTASVNMIQFVIVLVVCMCD